MIPKLTIAQHKILLRASTQYGLRRVHNRTQNKLVELGLVEERAMLCTVIVLTDAGRSWLEGNP